MLYVRVLLVASLLASAGGCATPPRHANGAEPDQKVLGERITRICALPEAERAVEVEKLKNESGMVLYCGK